MTQQVNANPNANVQLSEEELYELEWNDESPNEKAPDSGKVADGAKPDADDTDDSAAVADTAEDTNSESDTDIPAEEKKVDPWDSAPPELKQEYLKLQNDLKSTSGRHAAAERKRVETEKELARIKAVHAEATRKKGEYEQNHPELFNEVMAVVGARVPVQPEEPAPTVNDDAVRTVYKIHSDLDSVMQSPEWATFQGSLNAEQQAQFDSSDPYAFASLVTEFKTDRAAKRAAGSKSINSQKLAAAAAPVLPSQSKAAPRTRTSVQDDYDAEWDKA